jgi:hypothetical protein
MAGLQAPALYAGAGSDGAAFLKVEAGARAAAMGGAFAAVSDDASSVFYNPAGPALVQNNEILLSHAEWLEGLRNEHAAYVHVLSARLTLFAGLTALIIPALDEYDAVGTRTGDFSAMDGAAGAGLAVALGNDAYFGLFGKTVYQQADTRKAYAYAADIGFIQNYGETVRVGLAVQNFGTPIKLYSENFELPRTYRAGGAYRLMRRAWLTAEFMQVGHSDLAAAAGAEGEYAITARETVFARAGYKTGRSKNAGPGVSAGVGVRSGDIGVDYAFSPFGDLGDTHRFTLSYRFGEDRGDIFTERKMKRASRVKPAPAAKTKPAGGKAKVKSGGPKKEEPVYFLW